MSDRDRDLASLWDMAEAIREIQQFTAGTSEAEYLNSLLLQRVVERDFEILGEAARRISPEFQQEHLEIDWRNTIGLRNIIAHRYENVNHDVLWFIIQTVLPGLLATLEALLMNDPS
jgi:uncharacterized protein with HEPN domain